MKILTSKPVQAATARTVVTKITSKAAAAWYAENKLKNMSWQFNKGDTFSFYAVMLGDTIVACMAYTNGMFTSRCKFDKTSWPGILDLFDRPENQKLGVSTGIPHRLPYITGVQTALEHRGKGYAKRLLKVAIKLTKDNGKKFLFLSSAFQSTAYQLYEKLGFVDIAKSDLGRTERIMLKQIK